MVVLGIDADVRRVAWAVHDGRAVYRAGCIPRTNQAGRFDDRYDAAVTQLIRRAQDVGAVVYLEGIFLAGRSAANVAGFAALAEVQGELKLLARRHAVPLRTTQASVWYSGVLGLPPKAGRDRLKLASAEHAARLLPGRQLSQDEADAVCIAEYGASAERSKPAYIPPFPLPAGRSASLVSA